MLKPSQKVLMKFLEVILILFCNFFLVACSDNHHLSFDDALSDKTILHELAHNHGSFFKKRKTSRISKILKFQMDKILSQHKIHLNQGNMNRDHRKEFEQKLKIKFHRIKNYSKNRLRKDHKEKSRSIRSRKRLTRPRFKLAYHS